MRGRVAMIAAMTGSGPVPVEASEQTDIALTPMGNQRARGWWEARRLPPMLSKRARLSGDPARGSRHAWRPRPTPPFAFSSRVLARPPARLLCTCALGRTSPLGTAMWGSSPYGSLAAGRGARARAQGQLSFLACRFGLLFSCQSGAPKFGRVVKDLKI